MGGKIFGFAATFLLTVGLAACGNNSDNEDSAGKADDTTLKVDTSPTPHAEISEHVKPLLKDGGIDLEIAEFDDYILPSQSLEEDDIDTNYFQHIPYLSKEIKGRGYDSVDAGTVHIEPVGLYSKKVKDISELKDGATIITPDSESSWGRITTILQDAGSIKVKGGINLEIVTFDDIEENPKDLKFNHTIDPSLLASTYQNGEGDLVAINANFAYDVGLNPLEGAVLPEKDNSPYVNIIAARKGDENSDEIEKLIEVLHHKEIQEWITDKWGDFAKPIEADAE